MTYGNGDNHMRGSSASNTATPATGPSQVLRTQQIAKWKGPVPDTASEPKDAREACRKGMQYYQMIQCEDGHWAGDYGGPMFLMPGLIFACYITKVRRSVLGGLEPEPCHDDKQGPSGQPVVCHLPGRCLLVRALAHLLPTP